MSKITKKIIFIVLVFVLSFLLMTSVRAEVVWDGESKTITIPCGEVVTPYLNINSWIEPENKPANNNRYTIVENTGITILTLATPMNGNANNSYYDRMNVASSNIGQQVITIRFTPSGNNAQASDTTLTVNCVGSENLKTVVEALGAQMPNLYTLNTENVYTSLDSLTGAQYEAILDSNSAYNSLSDTEKNIVDNLMSEKLNKNQADVQQAANDGIERLANEFLALTKLNDNTISGLSEYRNVYANIPELSDEFESLSPRTKASFLNKVSNQNSNFETWAEFEAWAAEQLDIIDSLIFISNYIKQNEETHEIDNDAIIAGEEAWTNLNDRVKSFVNGMLPEYELDASTYPELLLKAKAIKFLNENLTVNGQVIVEANNSNYQQIIDAEENYNALSDEVKEIVNKILTEKGNTTYPELLLKAKAIKFLNEKLTVNEQVIVEANNSNYQQIIDAEENYNALSDEVKEIVNKILTEKGNTTYPELLLKAKAIKFLNEKLTVNEQVIVESNNSNYQQIIDAEENYNSLSDEVKEIVNKILTEKGNTTYPELLKDAQKLQPTPKTGDIVMYVIIALVISTIGLVVTFIKRK